MDRTVAKGETAVLQCIAGGSPPPRLNWTKDDSPLVVTERHFFAAANQLLIIVDAAEADVGKYTCEMSNALGTERGNVRLAVISNPNCDTGVQGGMGVGAVGGGRIGRRWLDHSGNRNHSGGVLRSGHFASLGGHHLPHPTPERGLQRHQHRWGHDAFLWQSFGYLYKWKPLISLDAFLPQMRPTCLQTFPVTCPPRARWLTDRTVTSRRRAAAVISTCRRPSVASTCSRKTWTVNTCPFFFVPRLNPAAASHYLYIKLFFHPYRSLSAGHWKWSGLGGSHRSSALPLSRTNRLVASQRQHLLHWSIRGLHRSVQLVCWMKHVPSIFILLLMMNIWCVWKLSLIL